MTTTADHVARCLDEIDWLLITARHGETAERRETALRDVLERVDYIALQRNRPAAILTRLRSIDAKQERAAQRRRRARARY